MDIHIFNLPYTLCRHGTTPQTRPSIFLSPPPLDLPFPAAAADCARACAYPGYSCSIIAGSIPWPRGAAEQLEHIPDLILNLGSFVPGEEHSAAGSQIGPYLSRCPGSWSRSGPCPDGEAGVVRWMARGPWPRPSSTPLRTVLGRRLGWVGECSWCLGSGRWCRLRGCRVGCHWC